MAARAPSKRVLVYDFAKNQTKRMSRSKFEKQYSVDDCVSIPLPKGASRIDVSPDDLSPTTDGEEDGIRVNGGVRTGTSRSLAGTASTSATVPRSSSQRHNHSSSYTASVHIPSSVFWARAIISPDLFPELIVVSPSTSPQSSPENSQSNSRSTTESYKTSGATTSTGATSPP